MLKPKFKTNIYIIQLKDEYRKLWGDYAYVGKTERTLDERFAEHKKMASSRAKTTNAEERKLYEAMRKFGPDKFEISPIKTVDFEDGKLCEIMEIEQRRTFTGPNGLNSSAGGEGGSRSRPVLLIEKDKKKGKIIDIMQCYNVRHAVQVIRANVPDIYKELYIEKNLEQILNGTYNRYHVNVFTIEEV